MELFKAEALHRALHTSCRFFRETPLSSRNRSMRLVVRYSVSGSSCAAANSDVSPRCLDDEFETRWAGSQTRAGCIRGNICEFCTGGGGLEPACGEALA